ncbi:transposase [Streptomyces sp. NPDC096030]|uniref:transposase n=1 Tax=Streptomyces sp. NPDC096030 TaxID=3155423 RepID=UPI0033231380
MYPPQFKADAVALYQSPPGATVKQIAADPGVSSETLCNWTRAAGAPDQQPCVPTAPEVDVPDRPAQGVPGQYASGHQAEHPPSSTDTLDGLVLQGREGVTPEGLRGFCRVLRPSPPVRAAMFRGPARVSARGRPGGRRAPSPPRCARRVL